MLNYNPLTKEEQEESYQAIITDNNEWEKEEEKRKKIQNIKDDFSNRIVLGIYLEITHYICGILMFVLGLMNEHMAWGMAVLLGLIGIAVGFATRLLRKEHAEFRDRAIQSIENEE